ncbi:MAG: hypothetical protein R2764_03785 [Bacteroidales bacterium]
MKRAHSEANIAFTPIENFDNGDAIQLAQLRLYHRDVMSMLPGQI